MSVDKLRVFHEEILEEEGMKVADLSPELQSKIKGFNLLRKKLEKNPEDERLFFQLQKSSVKIGDLVQSFIENDFDEDEEEEEGNENDKNKNDNVDKKPTPKTDNKVEVKKSTPKTDNTPPKNGSGKFGNSMMEKKIMSIMDARGEKRIKISDLEAIIGKEPNYPEQEVNNIKLRKVFLSNDYRLV